VRPNAPEALRDRGGRLLHLLALLTPDAGDFFENVWKARLTPSGRGRKIRAAVEGLQRRGEPHAHRPTAGSGRGLDERHVDAVDVGPFFTVDLDRHEVPVEHVGDLPALEALVLHDVAPVARRVSDREKDRLVLAAGEVKRLVAPWMPINGIVFVLEQVRAVFGCETVWHSSDYGLRAGRASSEAWPSSRETPGCRDGRPGVRPLQTAVP